MNLKEMMSLRDNNILITGGAGYLGEAISEVLAELNANLYICSRNLKKCEQLSERLNKEYNCNVYALEVDLSDIDSVLELYNNLKTQRVFIDTIVNNACFSSGKKLENMSEKEWLTGIDGAINSVFRVIKYFLPEMMKKQVGNIINISSMYGVVSPDTSIYKNNNYYNPANYGSGKAAIIQLTKYISTVYARIGIRSNCVSPGPFPNTEVQKDKEFIKKLEKKVPLGRIGKPEELKGVIGLLASKASSYINGANIIVDGGWTAW